MSLLDEPKQLEIQNRNEISCGIYAITLILNSLELENNAHKIEKLARENIAEANLGSLYQESSMIIILDILKKKYNINYSILEFSSFEDLKNICETKLNNGYILLPYYAMQGFVWKHKHPDMKHGHWGVFYKFENDKLYGVQSNQKAHKLHCLDSCNIREIYESNKLINDIKIDWGKYNKCKINIGRKELGIKPRCNNQLSCRYCDKQEFNCIYKSDIGNKAYIIEVGNLD